MPKLDIFAYDPTIDFQELACPHCGSKENLSVDIEGFWDCPTCEESFWITRARIVTMDEPAWARIVIDANTTDETISS